MQVNNYIWGLERHANAIMPQDLDQIAFPAPEAEHLARVGIAANPFLHLQRQRVHASPHIRPQDVHYS